MIDLDVPLLSDSHFSTPVAVDLGPLAWVVDSLRDTLHDVHEQLLAFSQEVAAASGSHLTTLDTAALRMTAQSLHEAVGVLDLVERPAAAKVVGAMERCVQLFVSNPELCVPEAAQTVEQAGTSVLDYLSSLLKGHPDHSPGLFPAYRAVAQLADIDRIHPADLWHGPWQWLEVADYTPTASSAKESNLPPFLDGILQLFRSGGTNGGEQLAARTLQLWQNGTTPKERVFWQLASGFLQLQSAQTLRFDDQVKRLLSRIAVQHDLLQQPSGEVSERLAQDLLYFIALGYNQKAAASPQLVQAIARRYQLDTVAVSDYSQLLYGTVNPAQRNQLRDAIASFKDLWSDVSSGNTHKIQTLSNHASSLPEKLHALWPAAAAFSSALQSVIQHIVQTEQAPHPEVAMEVATAILFLEASLEETTGDNNTFDERITLLAQRLETVQRSEQMESPTEWMEALYARLHNQGSMTQVVAEARTAIGEIEQALDDFFRHPQKTPQATESAAKLDKIAGVLLALNFEEASRAIEVMSQQVQQLVDASQQTGSIDVPEHQYIVLKLGNSLGALSFMLDMMGYQPELAKAQFHFDESTQELTHRNVATHGSAGTTDSAEPANGPATTSTQLGQTHIPALDDLISAQATGTLSPATAAAQLGGVIKQAELAGQPALAQQAREALTNIQTAKEESPDALAQAVSALAPATIIPSLPEDGIIDTPIEEEDLRDIFLEEASEVIGNALTAIEALHANMADTAQLTNLRRAFHTLKGSGRMVGLASFGEAAWEMERTLNGWLADGKPASHPLLQLATDALEALAEWRESIARQEKTRWHHAYFSQPAATMQESGSFVPITIPCKSKDAVAPSANVPAATETQTPATTSLLANAEPAALAEDEQALCADEERAAPLMEFALSKPFAQDEQDVFASDAEEASPFADDSEQTSASHDATIHAPAWSPSFMADLPSLDLPSLDLTAPAETPVADSAATNIDSTSPAEELLFAEEDAPFATEDTEIEVAPSSVPTTPAVADLVFADESIGEPATAKHTSQAETQLPETLSAMPAAATTAAALVSSPAPLAADAHTAAAPDLSSIRNALAGMLVDTTVQLAVLQDMVDGLPDEEIKHVGDMHIPLALFNTYLNEADVWSRQLVQELSEWVLDHSQPIPHDCSPLAHSLAGSSAAVGMCGLASMARGIEHAIDRVEHRSVRTDEADTLYRAAETVRQELHQFAAGLYQPVNMPLLCKLAAIVENIPLDALSATIAAAKGLTPEHFLHPEKKNAELPAATAHAPVAIAPGSDIAESVESSELPASVASEDAAPIALNAISTATPAHADEAALPAKDSDKQAQVETPTQAKPATDKPLPAAPAQPAPNPEQTAPPPPVAAAVPTAAHRPPVLAAYDATPDSIDTDLFEIFSEEAQTLLPQLHAVTRQWIARPDNAGARAEAQRLLHTFKGGARLAGAMQLGAMAHDMESAIGDITDIPSAQTLEQLQSMLDEMDDHFTGLRLDTLGPGSVFATTGFANTGFAHTSVASPAAAAPLLTDFTFDEPSTQAAPDSSASTPSATVTHNDAPTSRASTPASEHKQPTASTPVDTVPTKVPAAESAPSFDSAKQEEPAPAPTTAVSTTSPVNTLAPAAPAVTPQRTAPALQKHLPAAMPAPQALIQPQVRVRSNVLDRMLGSTGEVMISRARLETEVQQLRQAMTDMDGSLSRLRTQLRDMELQAETQMQSRMAQSAESAANFDPLEFDRFTRVQELTRMMAESVNDVASVQRNMIRAMQSTEDNLIVQARQTRELQSDLLRSRMVEFDSLSERLYRVVRQAAKENGKQVTLNISGAHTAMDRNIIERIASPFEHLLRNAVVHGIEAPNQRTQAGKEATGHIEINLQQAGNEVMITVRDDGKGLDVPRIREKAIAAHLLKADESISDENAMQLIFKSGFSTTDNVTSLAGRGVGMDVVRTEVNALGGRIETKSQQQVGTEFTLVLPLTTAVTHVVEVQAGDLRFGVPSSLVESVQSVSAKEIQQAYNSHTFVVNGESLPFYWAGAMLQSSRRSADMSAKRQSVLVLHSATQRIVMHVDAVLGNHEVVVKNIGPQLARMPGLSSITVLPNGTMLFIYNPVALAFYYNEAIRVFSSDLADPAVLEAEASVVEAPAPLVLIVDDSITVRRVTGRLLQREGYRIATAADGLAALHAIAEEKPDVVLSDIEMPQMDGFELLRNIRNNTDLQDLPVIMITSRTASKHREHAEELGSNGFLGKPYSEEALLEQLRQHTRQPIKK